MRSNGRNAVSPGRCSRGQDLPASVAPWVVREVATRQKLLPVANLLGYCFSQALMRAVPPFLRHDHLQGPVVGDAEDGMQNELFDPCGRVCISARHPLACDGKGDKEHGEPEKEEVESYQ